MKAGETTDKRFKPCLSLHDFFFPLSSHILFLQLCRFTSISLPPICTCPAHASLPSLHFYQPLSSLYVVIPSTHIIHTQSLSFPTLSLLYFHVLNCPFPPSLLVIHPTPLPLLSELYPNPSVHSLSSYASVSHSPVLSFPPVPDWIIIIPQMDFRSDDSAFRMNI